MFALAFAFAFAFGFRQRLTHRIHYSGARVNERSLFLKLAFLTFFGKHLLFPSISRVFDAYEDTPQRFVNNLASIDWCE